jgi:hypothetical protein
MVRLDAIPPSVSEDVTNDIQWPPTNLFSDEPPLETDFHRRQIDLYDAVIRILVEKSPRFLHL